MLSGIILAGGKSSRLGVDKSFVKVGGVELIERVISVLEPICDEIIISTNFPKPFERYGFKTVVDIHPIGGALAGIHAGLTAMSAQRGIFVACDMPFLNRKLIEYMRAQDNADAIVPVWKGEYEPLHAIYSKNCLGAIRRSLASGKKRIISFYEDIKVKVVSEEEVMRFDPEGLTFFNINTLADLERAKIIARENGSKETTHD